MEKKIAEENGDSDTQIPPPWQQYSINSDLLRESPCA